LFRNVSAGLQVENTHGMRSLVLDYHKAAVWQLLHARWLVDLLELAELLERSNAIGAVTETGKSKKKQAQNGCQSLPGSRIDKGHQTHWPVHTLIHC
jgi:hypothetical protein